MLPAVRTAAPSSPPLPRPVPHTRIPTRDQRLVEPHSEAGIETAAPRDRLGGDLQAGEHLAEVTARPPTPAATAPHDRSTTAPAPPHAAPANPRCAPPDTRHTGNQHSTTRDYLTALAGWGYTLSDVERLAAGMPALDTENEQDGDSPDED